ncbi:hypothetical protein C3L50_08790 [Flavobacterium alvei]|uniref:site-specific DNA-methyltransferase (adenine-specific) n=1 Tax=Flavobacterium alvei TaxID=2080416 RepID=A0A2S5ACE4_9FLAO|nr:Eco57I restriction-modification methylase domain-containing protein [Flavobacterium alvei]POY39917.1 hypothetical protein C3L50_08790 [Flavobacterium alvei]
MEKVRENEFLVDVLKKLDFFSSDPSIKNDFPEIVFTKNPSSNLHPKHYIALEFAENLEADAVYFKYYDDNRFCVPQVYFYDNSNGIYDKNKIAEIHRNVYSSNQVALIVVVDTVSIQLFDTKESVKLIDNQISNLNCLIKETPFNVEEKLKILKGFFNAKKLNSGLFWENRDNSKHFLKNTSAYEKLVEILNKIKFGFIKDFTNKSLKKDFAEDLLFKCILIKYLEENGLEYAQKFYKKNKIGYNTLNEILSNKKIIDLFTALEGHFNGGVFEISPRDKNGNIDLIEKEKRENYLKENSLETLAEHLDGTLDKGNQISLWQEYSFKYMPIELISNFYEEFIQKEEDKNKGTVYTPSHLVNLLIDECLPISANEEDLKTNVKLADVSCGSGIFITTAFKRLVQRLRVRKWVEAGRPTYLPNPTLKEVKDILTKNIFGVDLHPTAVKLTKFSLQLALCQLVPNDELWTWNDEKVFENLENENIFQEDFFDFLSKEKYHNFHESFDLIIGNPPFFPLTENKEKPEYSTITKKLKQEINFEFSVKIPDNQLALMFLEASSVLLKPKADLCFIQKSTSLLFNKGKGVKEFRNSLFNQFYVHQIIDFTLLKNYLYKSKSKTTVDDLGKPIYENGKLKKTASTAVESCAIFYKKEKVEDYNTLHIVSRLLKNTIEGLSFEFDYYDFHELSKNQILEDDTIWRSNLLGGNRLNHLIKKLNVTNSFQTNLKDYVLNHLGIDERAYSEGFMKGTPQGKIDGKNFFCDYASNKDVLFVSNFKENKLIKFPENFDFYYVPNEKAFLGPLMTIRENILNGKLFYLTHNCDVAYDSQIVGISFAELNKKDIISFENKIKVNEKINALKTVSTCSKFFLGKSSVITKKEIDNWTIPLNSDEIQISFAEKIVMNDVLDNIYPSWYEKKPKVNEIATIIELNEFEDIFNQSFNSIYKKEDKEQRLRKLFIGNDFYALEFYYSNESYEKQIIKNAEFEIDEIIRNNISRNAVVNRVLKIYGENTITLIKPKNLRYWLKSIALRDVDDVFDEMIEAGF